MARLEEKKIGRSSLAPYGESVKRHLESFDIEASLNEMADGSGRIAEFSKIYRQRAHDNQRIGMTPQSMPRLEEVDEMLKQSERIQMSLQRMRDVVFNHHQASLVETPQDPRYRPINGYDDGGSGYGDDNKGMGGFTGGDNKIRKRGVSSSLAYSLNMCTDSMSSVLLHPGDAIAAIVLRHPSGGEGQTVPEPCAMLVACVSSRP